MPGTSQCRRLRQRPDRYLVKYCNESLAWVCVPGEGSFGVRFPSPCLQVLSLSGFSETRTGTNDKAITWVLWRTVGVFYEIIRTSSTTTSFLLSTAEIS